MTIERGWYIEFPSSHEEGPGEVPIPPFTVILSEAKRNRRISVTAGAFGEILRQAQDDNGRINPIDPGIGYRVRGMMSERKRRDDVASDIAHLSTASSCCRSVGKYGILMAARLCLRLLLRSVYGFALWRLIAASLWALPSLQ